MHNRTLPMIKAVLFAGVATFCVAAPASAQQIASDWAPFDDGATSVPAPEAEAAPARSGRERPRVDVTPYIEAQQVLLADISGGGEVLTYSTLAVGVDASVQTSRAEAQVSVRYERVFGYDDGIASSDTVSGLARGAVKVARGLSIEAGGIATRSTVDGRGQSSTSFFPTSDNVTQVYSVYAGPTYSGQVGDLAFNAAYRAGYTKIESSDAGALPPGQQPIDIFDDSISQSAAVSVGMQPGALPVGWSVGAGWDREDASQLDQRFDSKYVRADVTVPVTSTFAVVGGVGYEDVKISERDAVRDAGGIPVVGADGRLVTDKSSPRLTAWESDGLIWDAGVMWRPSSRTALEARYGRRYDSDTYTGSFSYTPNANTGVNISVYDTVNGFGNALNDSLATLPTQFRNSRNPLTGDLNNCAFSSGGGLCMNNALRTASSASFRQRGVSASIATSKGGWDSGLAVGYDRRKFIASGLGAQAGLDGVIDENYWIVGSLGRELGRTARFESSIYGNYNDPGLSLAGDSYGFGANAGYYKQLWRGLSASAAVGVDSFKQEDFDSEVTASALLGLRYSF